MQHEKRDLLPLLARCFQGLEEVLAEELKSLGADDIIPGKRAVSFRGDLALLYRVNLSLRTALDVNLHLFEGKATTEQDYYKALKNYPWEDLYTGHLDTYISVSGTSAFSNHSLYLAQKAKDAVADRLREKTGQRPSVGKGETSLPVMVHFHGPQFSVWLNTSGEPLFKRGYRDSGSRNRAPLNESLAAGLILLSGWNPQTPFLDLMCGSATLPIEAAMIRHQIKPNANRAHFAFMNLPNFDKHIYRRESAQETDSAKTGTIIRGSDASANNIKKAKQNLHDAKVSDLVQLQTAAMEETTPPEGAAGTIILNPPYGERMDLDPDIEKLYESIGSTFKHNYPGYNAWIFTSNMEALKKVGLRPFRRFKLYNGPLECVFAGYKLYAGTKKIHKLRNDDK